MRLGDPGSFLPSLVSLMQSAELKIPYRMDLILNTPGEPAILINDNAESLKFLRQKSAFFTQQLQRNGLPKKMMSAGLGLGENGFIEIYFKPYQSLSPVVTNQQDGDA